MNKKLDKFFFTPASPRPLVALRIGLALCLIAEAYLLRGQLINFFAHDGFVQGELARYLNEPYAPKLGWIVNHLAPYGFSETSIIFWTARIYFASLLMLLFGLWTRPAALVAWFLQWMLMNSGYCNAYGFDMYAHIFLFYLIWVPSAGGLSVDHLLGRSSGAPSSAARVGIRTMQLHLALSYFASAIEKSSGIQWWNGELLWRALTLPEYAQLDFGWLAYYPIIPKLAGWWSLLVEGGFCFFIWSRRTRPLWVLFTVALHLGIAIFLGLHLFGAIMCVFAISLFGISAEPALQEQEVRSCAVNSSPYSPVPSS